MRLLPVALHVPRAGRPCTWRETTPVSALMYPAGSCGRPARREGVTPGGTAGRPGFGPGRYRRRRRGRGGVRCRPGRAVRAGRALRGAGRGLSARGGVASHVRGGGGLRGGGLRGGGGELVGAGLVGDHLRDTEADQLVDG